jgi:hypothetical protein
MMRTPGRIRSTAKALGEDTDAVLVDYLGLDREEVRALRERGALSADACGLPKRRSVTQRDEGRWHFTLHGGGARHALTPILEGGHPGTSRVP